MNLNLKRAMQETMRLMRSGDVRAATSAIQHALHDTGSAQMPPERSAPTESRSALQGRFRVLRDGAADAMHAPAPTIPDHDHRDVSDGTFRDQRFTCEAGSMHYKLFIPGKVETAALPLIVMLHGCTQSPDDFARGTRMNVLAREHGYVVAYPAQSKNKNASKCWNWFRSGDQQRGKGEPAILAALTRHLVGAHGLDHRRVYVAGLSAGGAMAAVLASTYPDVYAAVGVHSGLPCGVAHDLPSALAAMKQNVGKPSPGVPPARAASIPTIVFHGDRDTTVDSRNGAAVIEQCIGNAGYMSEEQAHSSRATVERGLAGGRRYTRTTYTNAAGMVMAEQWLVHGAGHAWFGGDAAGSYTDRSGPDASEHMLRFFSNCVRRTTDPPAD